MWSGKSLTLRVIVLSSLWAVVALVVAGGLISALYEQTAKKGFEDLLAAQLYNLVNSVSATEKGYLSGTPDLGDLRYLQPLSGWYWEVVPASPNTSGRLSSGSLGILEIAGISTDAEPFDSSYRRRYAAKGLDGETLQVVETEVVLDSQNHAARFRVMGNASTVATDIGAFDRTLLIYLGAVGLGTILMNVLAILIGLKPLGTVRKALATVRAGEAERLEGRFPVEIEPLAAELNALIDNNRRIVERSRTQVGNLAHSLKTPIAVLVNEAEAIGGEHGKLIGDQSARMQAQVQHYLDRARVAGQVEGGVFRTPVAPALDRLTRVVAKLNPEMKIAYERTDAAALVFAGEREDFEEIIGNLLENAAKWGRHRIALSARSLSADRFETVIADDGPGLSQADIDIALERGKRLDEAVPGSGLGLSIVADMVREYRGRFELARSDLGGLKAMVVLPRAP